MKYIATNLEESEAHALGIKAAEMGLSKSKLLKKLAQDFLRRQPAAKSRKAKTAA